MEKRDSLNKRNYEQNLLTSFETMLTKNKDNPLCTKRTIKVTDQPKQDVLRHIYRNV